MKILKTKQTISRILATQELRTTKKICSFEQPLKLACKFPKEKWDASYHQLLLTTILMMFGLIPNFLIAQTETIRNDSNMLTITSRRFEYIDSTKANTGILIERAVMGYNLDNYKGDNIGLDSFCNYDVFNTTYLNLYNGAYKFKQVTMKKLDSFTKSRNKFIKQNFYPIGVICAKFNSFNTETLDPTKLYIDSAGFYRTNVTNGDSLFQVNNVYVASMLQNIVYGGNSFISIIDPSLIYTNLQGNLNYSYRVDDETYFHQINLGSPFVVNYNGVPGGHTIYIKISDGITEKTTKSKFYKKINELNGGLSLTIYDEADRTLFNNATGCVNVPNIEEGNMPIVTHIKCNASIKDPNNQDRDILLIVEAFDPDNYDQINEGVVNHGNLGIVSFLKGYFDSPDSKDIYPHLRQTKQMLTKLLDTLGKDIVYIDFKNNGNPVFYNANVVIKVMNYLNQNVKHNGKPIDLLGPSMGGIVGKLALSKMQQQDCQHCAGTFFSFDSPQQGANIPAGILATISFAFSTTGTGKSSYDKLNSGAAQNLNYLNMHSEGNISQEHLGCYQAIESYGYPNCRKVAITSGSFYGHKQGFNPQDQLFNVKPSSPVARGRMIIDIYALPHLFQPNSIADRKNVFNGKLKGNEGHLFIPNSMPCFDNAPGGQIDALVDFKNQIGTYAKFDMLNDVWGNLPHLWLTHVTLLPNIMNHGERFCFIPTISALDIRGSGDIYEDFSLLTDDQRLARSPFDKMFWPKITDNNGEFLNVENQMHVKPYWRNIGFFADELMSDKSIIYRNKMPNVQGNHFNLNKTIIGEKFNVVYSMDIFDQGSLHLFAYQKYGYFTPGFIGLDEGNYTDYMDFYTQACKQTHIIIRDGGKMYLGDPNLKRSLNNNTNSYNKAELFLKNKDTIEILGGGELNIYNGSGIHFPAGSIFYVHAGAKINLYGDESFIDMNEGVILIDQNTTFTFAGDPSGVLYAGHTGYLRIKRPNGYSASRPFSRGGPLVSTIYNRTLTLKGDGKYDKTLVIEQDDINFSNLNQVNFQNMQIQLGDNAKLIVGTPLNMLTSSIVAKPFSSYPHFGLATYGQNDGSGNSTVSITDVEIRDGKFGYYQYAPEDYVDPVNTFIHYEYVGTSIDGLKISNCETGIYSYGKKLNLSNSNISYAYNSGWQGEHLLENIDIEKVKIFDNYASSYTGHYSDYGIIFNGSGISTLTAKYSKVEGNKYGIRLANFNLTTNCAKIYKNQLQNVQMQTGTLEASYPSQTDFSNATNALYMTGISYLKLSSGNNNLYSKKLNSAGKIENIYFSVDNCHGGTNSIQANGNQWNLTGSGSGNNGVGCTITTTATSCGAPSTTLILNSPSPLIYSDACYVNNNGPDRIKGNEIKKDFSNYIESDSEIVNAYHYKDLFNNNISLIKKSTDICVVDELVFKKFRQNNKILSQYLEKKDKIQLLKNSYLKVLENIKSCLSRSDDDFSNDFYFELNLIQSDFYYQIGEHLKSIEILNSLQAYHLLAEQKFTAQNWECLRKADYTWAKEKMEIGQLDSMVQICNKNRVNIKEQTVDNNGNNTDIGIQGLIIKPNPSTGLFTIEFKAASEKAIVTIYNSVGQVVYTKLLNVIQEENQTLYLDFQTTLPAGIYHCVLENGTKRSNQKIIIQK